MNQSRHLTRKDLVSLNSNKNRMVMAQAGKHEWWQVRMQR